MLRSQFTSIPGTVFKGSKGEQHEVSLSANNRKRTLFVRQLVSAIPFVEPTNFWTTHLVFHTASLSKSLERHRHGVAAWTVGGKPSAAAIPFLEGRVSLKSSGPREGRGNGDSISALLCPLGLEVLLPRSGRGWRLQEAPGGLWGSAPCRTAVLPGQAGRRGVLLEPALNVCA